MTGGISKYWISSVRNSRPIGRDGTKYTKRGYGGAVSRWTNMVYSVARLKSV